MDKLIKASLIASIATISWNMETSPVIKLDWDKIENDFCMTQEALVKEYGEDFEYAYREDTYYIRRFDEFSKYISGLIEGAGGEKNGLRNFTYNSKWGNDFRDDLFTPHSKKSSLYYLYKENKDKFEAKVNEMLLNELAESKDKKDKNKKDENKKDENKKGSSNNKGIGCWCF